MEVAGRRTQSWSWLLLTGPFLRLPRKLSGHRIVFGIQVVSMLSSISSRVRERSHTMVQLPALLLPSLSSDSVSLPSPGFMAVDRPHSFP